MLSALSGSGKPMKIEQRKLDDLKPYPNNLRQNGSAVEPVAAETDDDQTVPARRQLRWRPSDREVVEAVCQHFGVDDTVLTETRRHGNDARAATINLLRQLTDELAVSLARRLGNISPAAASQLITRTEQRRTRDEAWNQLLDDLRA